MSEKPTYYARREPDDKWTGIYYLDEASAAPAIKLTPPTIPEPIAALLNLIAQLPAGVQASGRGTEHFELTAPGEGAWLYIGGFLDPYVTATSLDYVGEFDRLQILLDLAAAAKAAEAILRYHFAAEPITA